MADTLQPTFYPGPGVWTYTADPAVARVLAVRNGEFRAHWDSGRADEPAVIVTLFNGTKVWEEKLSVGYKLVNADGTLEWYSYTEQIDLRSLVHFVDPEINATEEDQARYAALVAARSYIRGVASRVAEALKIRPSHTQVDVVKGRKVPKGRYEVTGHRIGDYGPVVDLRDAEGKSHRYVAVGNVRVVPDFAFFIANSHTDAAEVAFLVKIAEAKFDPTEWGVFCDYVTDHGLPASIRGHYSDADGWSLLNPGYFAEAVRNVLAGKDGEYGGNALHHWQNVLADSERYNELRGTGRY